MLIKVCKNLSKKTIKNNNQFSSVTEVNCSFCNDEHVLWNQFECLVCLDYNLCSKCHEKQRYNRQHRPYHPMQLVMSQLDYFKFRNSVVQPNIGLSCPFCGNIKSNIDEFLQHCFVRHDHDLYNVRCPICVSFCIPECQNIVSPAISFKKHLEKCHEVRQKGALDDFWFYFLVTFKQLILKRFQCQSAPRAPSIIFKETVTCVCSVPSTSNV